MCEDLVLKIVLDFAFEICSSPLTKYASKARHPENVYELNQIAQENTRMPSLTPIPNERIRHIVHSKLPGHPGSSEIYRIDELDRIDVETYGSAKIIPRDVYYISKWDAIPAIACPKDYVLARMGRFPMWYSSKVTGCPSAIIVLRAQLIEKGEIQISQLY